MSSTFRARALAIVSGIPRGTTMTYGEVARHAGNPRAARAVGALMRTNHDPTIPCHRVVGANGQLGGYNRGSAEKLRLLKLEKARF